jgi:hypothetical protein
MSPLNLEIRAAFQSNGNRAELSERDSVVHKRTGRDRPFALLVRWTVQRSAQVLPSRQRNADATVSANNPERSKRLRNLAGRILLVRSLRKRYPVMPP